MPGAVPDQASQAAAGRTAHPAARAGARPAEDGTTRPPEPPGRAPLGEDAVPVEVLTDEELAILAGPGGLVVSPFLATASDGDHAAVTRTAYRGLLARGILEPPTARALADAVGEATVEVQVRQDVLTVVTLRRAAPVVVCVARTSVLAQDYWYAHVVDDVVLVEQVGSDGLHRFALARTEQLGDLVVDATIHPECGDGAGPDRELPDDGTVPVEIAEQLGTALLRTDLVVRTVGDEHAPLTGLFTGPAGAWTLTARAATREPLVARPVSRADLEAAVRVSVSEALAHAHLVPEG
ncbi:MAG TPA: hypothetical protein VGC57_03405 [Cellulomonas sp.]